MKIIAHTKYGTFHGKETEYTEEGYEDIKKFLSQIAELSYLNFRTDDGVIYMTKKMINDSLFILQK